MAIMNKYGDSRGEVDSVFQTKAVTSHVLPSINNNALPSSQLLRRKSNISSVLYRNHGSKFGGSDLIGKKRHFTPRKIVKTR